MTLVWNSAHTENDDSDSARAGEVRNAIAMKLTRLLQVFLDVAIEVRVRKLELGHNLACVLC